jgi:hypothetical protein
VSALHELWVERPDRSWVVLVVQGSFDCVADSLRGAATSRKMTIGFYIYFCANSAAVS